MAKVYQQKARKEYKCSKCGCTIHPGETYFKSQPYGRSEIIRCKDHRPERSELTGSEYYSWLWDLQDHLSDRYDLRSEEAKDEIYSELENMRDDLQGRLDNMPDSLQYGSTGELLQDRIDSLDSAMSDLGNLDYPVLSDYQNDDDESDEDEDEGEDDTDPETSPANVESEETEDDGSDNEEYQSALDEWESAIEEAISNIE